MAIFFFLPYHLNNLEECILTSQFQHISWKQKVVVADLKLCECIHLKVDDFVEEKLVFQEENPIYNPATTKFHNPAYSGETE